MAFNAGALRRTLIMYTQRMFDMWSSVTSKLEAHANNLGQSNVQSPAGQNNSSGSIKGKEISARNFPISSKMGVGMPWQLYL